MSAVKAAETLYNLASKEYKQLTKEKLDPVPDFKKKWSDKHFSKVQKTVMTMRKLAERFQVLAEELEHAAKMKRRMVSA